MRTSAPHRPRLLVGRRRRPALEIGQRLERSLVLLPSARPPGLVVLVRELDDLDLRRRLWLLLLLAPGRRPLLDPLLLLLLLGGGLNDDGLLGRSGRGGGRAFASCEADLGLLLLLLLLLL